MLDPHDPPPSQSGKWNNIRQCYSDSFQGSSVDIGTIQGGCLYVKVESRDPQCLAVARMRARRGARV